MTDPQKYRMRLVRAHMDYITAEINDDCSNDSYCHLPDAVYW